MNFYWASAGSFVFFIVIGLVGGSMLHLEGPRWYFFLGLMSALGLSSAALFYYFQRRAEQRGQGSGAAGAASGGSGASGPNETDPLLRDASARLAQSKAGAGIANLPMIFVIGDRGTAKTSTILQSGIEPELLAGQVYQDNAVTPTRTANIFYARGTVFVEAGGAVLGNPQAWSRLVARLQPGKLKSLGGGQAPRGVLLCFDLETFTRPGAAEAIANAARYLQARLGEVSQILGVSFPVYVLFTRADRLPYFAEFVRNLSSQEAGQVVGATLPMRPAHALGVYGEEENQRLSAAFNQLFHTFCDHRLRLLPRETDADKLPQAYEFPREFRKLRSALVQFLVDIGRPSQLRSSPFLRGFYFSGVRPVTMTEVAAAPLATPAQQAELGGATGMFRAGLEAQRRSQQAQAAPGGGSRKVPQWLFLGHLFNDVILADEAARRASGSSTKTSTLKRALFATAAGLCLLYAVLLLVSFFGNRALEQRALDASRGLNGIAAANNAVPAEDSLRKLDTLRQSLAELTDYEYNGAPLRLRWGLYSGSSILPSVRRAYYAKFNQLLFGSTEAGILAFLQRTPVTPGASDDYGYGYDSLKSYLLTSSEWKRSSDQSLQDFLASRLRARWSSGRENEIGPARMDLAKLQFDFYAHDLQHGNPYPSDNDSAAVDRTRSYLSKFSGVQRVYQFLLAESAKNHPPTTFNRKFPGTADAVTSPVEVAWAFTRDGWKFMQDQIKRQNFGGEQWVLGPYQSQGVDRGAMEKGILDLYTKDYVEQWRNVLRRSNVNRYGSYQDASRKLTLLTGSGAPLLALMWWTSQNTAIDLPGVSDKFKAVQAVVPPSQAQQYIVQSNQSYNGGLMNLQQAVDRAANKDPSGEQSTRDSAQSARLTARQLSATFPPDPEGHVDQRTEELLLQPITYLDNLAGGDLRAGGAAFCAAFNPLTAKFPFNPTATAEVTLDELGGILRPQNGKLWTFYESSLKSVMQCPNGECTPQGSTPINPVFVRYISQMMKFSRAVYGDSGQEPNLHYTLRPQATDQVDEFGVAVNGELAQLKGGASKQFVWPGAGTRNFRLDLKVAGGSQLGAQSYDGPWAVFRFFADANRTTNAGNGYIFTWAVTSGRSQQPQMVKGRPLIYEFFVDTGGGPAVFSKDFFVNAEVRCSCNTVMEHPSRIGKYEVEEYLGGGMSRVYRAKDSVLGRRVALKILADSVASDAEAKARFLQEARLASSIAHENIIAVYDFGEDDGRPFMVMEFLEGESLRDAIEKRRTGDFARRLQIALQVGRAIGHIHLKKIVHRDIKPENIHLDPLGRAKLMDFGIAKSDGMRLTKTGFTLGTPYYMSPEQVLGQDVTTQADVYSFGVLLYELLAGKKPIEAENFEKIFHKILYEPLNLEPLHEANVAPAAIDLIRKCMAKPPAERPQGFGIVCGAIEETLKQGALQPRPAPPEPAVTPSSADELPPFLQALPAPLRTQGGLAFLGGLAALLVMVAIYFGLRLARII